MGSPVTLAPRASYFHPENLALSNALSSALPIEVRSIE
jgi:hypothetical protein